MSRKKTERTINRDLIGSVQLNPQRKRILVLAANPIDTTWLRLDEELREIRKSIDRSKYRDNFHLERELAVSNRDFRQAMLNYKPHILYFTGHGNNEGIILDGDLGNAAIMNADALTQLFKFFNDNLECVILSACYSETQAKAINEHINYVIGMKGAILERSGIEFAVGFFDALGAGYSYEDAYEIGKIAISQEIQKSEESEIPVLFANPPQKIEGILNKPEIETVQIKFHIQNSGEVFDNELRLNASTRVEKNRLINSLELPRQTDNKEPIEFYLYSLSRKRILDDAITIKQNGITSGEELAFMVEIDG